MDRDHPQAPLGVIGVGYVGLVTGVCFAHLGRDVVCMDLDEQKIARLRSGTVPIYEPGLEELMVAAGPRLTFTASYGELFEACRTVFVAVDTPPSPSGDADLSRIERVVAEVGRAGGERLLVMKSTVPVGTGGHVVAQLEAAGATSVGYVSNPEFLREGAAVDDVLHPDRIVVGAYDPDAAERVAALYSGIDAPIVHTSVATAEMIKYAANAFLATKISFINEIANVCEQVGASTGASDRTSCRPASASAAPASPRTSRPSSSWPATRAITSSCSPPSSRSTPCRSAAWSPS